MSFVVFVVCYVIFVASKVCKMSKIIATVVMKRILPSNVNLASIN